MFNLINGITTSIRGGTDPKDLSTFVYSIYFMKKITLKSFFWISFSLGILCLLAIFTHYFRYRYIPLVLVGTESQIEIDSLEVYTNQLTYQIGDSIFIHIKSNQSGFGELHRIESDHTLNRTDSFQFNKQQQDIHLSQSKDGCFWKVSDTILVTRSHNPGYYSLDLKTTTDTTSFRFIIENRTPSKIAVLAPASTWVAYNNWGGQSLYHNYIEDKTTYYVSSQRPYPNHDVRVEAHSTNYFIDNYNAILLPDYALEYDMDLLNSADVIVLNYHAEYFTETMYNNLVSLLEDGHKSLISLGGNQMYWKTQWHNGYKTMECRKDLTSFDDHYLNYGGMWRHHYNKAEHHILGVQFTDAGMHSYAPYEVKHAEHWIYKDTYVKPGDIFGLSGIDNLPLSGDETDKMNGNSDQVIVLAKGLNCSKNNPIKGLDDNCLDNAGADFVLKTNPNYLVLSTGSIQSGSGLGIDTVFTKMIQNFIEYSTQ